MKRKFSVFLSGLLTFALLAGCSPAGVPDSSGATAGGSVQSAQDPTTKPDAAAPAQTSPDSQASAQPDGALKKITFVLDWTPNTNHTGLFVAKEKGYFKEAGFDVDLVQPPEGGAASLVAAGKAQYGIDFQDYLADAFAKEEPLPVTAIAAVLQNNTSGIISLKSKNITRPKDLEGKTYASWDLPIEKKMMEYIVTKDGGDFSKVKVIPNEVQDVLSALKTNVDAVWVYEGWDVAAAKAKGVEVNFMPFRSIEPVAFNFYSPVIIGGNDYLKQNPNEVKAFLKAVKRGYDFAIDKPEEAAAILMKADPALDQAIVLESQKFISGEYKKNARQWGMLHQTRWDMFYSWLYNNKAIDRKIPDGFGMTTDYINDLPK